MSMFQFCCAFYLHEIAEPMLNNPEVESLDPEYLYDSATIAFQVHENSDSDETSQIYEIYLRLKKLQVISRRLRRVTDTGHLQPN